MSRWAKVGAVIGGYLLALLAGCGAMAGYQRRFSPTDMQTMGGMIAGGEMLYGGAVLALIALVPTGLALWFLRRRRGLWSALSVAGLIFAVLGLGAAIAVLASRGSGPTRSVPILAIELLGIVQMLGSPLWTSAFVLFAMLAPAPDLRRRMLVAAAIEIIVALCALVHFLPRW